MEIKTKKINNLLEDPKMSEYKLKTGKVGEAVVGTYKKIEDTVVGGYKKIEDGVVGGYKKIEGAFVETFLEKVDDNADENK